MEIQFKKIKYRFVKSLVDISDDLDKILESKQTEGNITSGTGNKNIKFKKLNDKIQIDFEGEHFQIDKEPICFVNEDNKSLFKIYDSSNQIYIDKIRKGIENKYEFFLQSGDKIEFKEIFIKGIKTIVIKLKNNQYNNIFKPLCMRLETKEKILEINTNCFLPKDSPSLHIDHFSKFKLIIDKRKVLINKINDFMENDKKFIFKIYGSNGIGKSITYLYFSTIKTNYKIIYFNLKDIFIGKQTIQEYFKNALMKYYSSNNYYCEENVSQKIDNDKYDKFNYNIYLSTIKILESKSLFINGDLWDMLNCFCDYIEDDGNSLIILDQYKSEYDNENKLINLKKIITKYSQNRSIKFIISSSLNDNTVKQDLIADLLYIYNEQIEFIKSIEKTTIETEKNDIEDELFTDFDFVKNDNENINEDFQNITLFNLDKVDDLTKKRNNEIEKTKNDDIINENEKKIINKYMNIDSRLTDLTEIIYINNLISVEEIIPDSDKKLFKLFNFNPESYSIFNIIFHTNSNIQKDILHKSFLDLSFKEIDRKVGKFYQNLKNNKYINYSADYLKYTFLMKLREIIEKKYELNLKEWLNNSIFRSISF